MRMLVKIFLPLSLAVNVCGATVRPEQSKSVKPGVSEAET
jgi:hypothetical protein